MRKLFFATCLDKMNKEPTFAAEIEEALPHLNRLPSDRAKKQLLLLRRACVSQKRCYIQRSILHPAYQPFMKKLIKKLDEWGVLSSREERAWKNRTLGNDSILERIEVRRITNIPGKKVAYGIFAREKIRKGEVLGEYMGEYWSESILEKYAGREETEYFMNLFNDLPRGSENFGIEAARYGNWASFMNHASQTTSEDCNVEFISILTKCGHLIIQCITLREIKPGEQLAVDYGSEKDEYWGAEEKPLKMSQMKSERIKLPKKSLERLDAELQKKERAICAKHPLFHPVYRRKRL